MAEPKVFTQSFAELYGPKFGIYVNDQQMGIDGRQVYQLYGVTDQDLKSSIRFSESGALKIHSDKSIEIAAGALSNCLPPWLETQIASAPMFFICCASGTDKTPFTIKCPVQNSRNFFKKSQLARERLAFRSNCTPSVVKWAGVG